MSRRPHSHLGRLVEVLRVFARLIRSTQGEEKLSLKIELENQMASDVGDPDVIRGIHMQPVQPKVLTDWVRCESATDPR